MQAVLIITVGANNSFNILCNRLHVVVLPFVPVTQMMKKSLDGFPLIKLAIFQLILFHH
jgi:hypothetical protein